MSEDFPEIYLEPDPDPCGDRQWCQHDFWSDDPEYGGLAATKYIRADLVDAKDAEILRLRAELAALREPAEDLVEVAKAAIEHVHSRDGIVGAVLDAVLPRVRAEGWRTMESAPKDGSKVDLWSLLEGRISAAWFERNRWVHFWIGDFDHMETTPVEYPTQLTHWRPLPPPPDAAP